MQKFYGIKEFSELTSVTIRALRYYEEIGLLKPSSKKHSGHRLYSQHDLLRLQQITTLKFMGFSLEEIKKIIQKPGFDFKNSLRNQAIAMAEEAERISKAAKLLEHSVKQLDFDSSINWEIMAKIIEVMQMGEANKHNWHEKFLSDAEKLELDSIHHQRPKEFWEAYSKKWAELFEEIESNLHTDPESELGMGLAKKWLGLVNEVYSGHPELSKKLWEGYKAGIIPEYHLSFNPGVVDYIAKASRRLKELNCLASE